MSIASGYGPNWTTDESRGLDAQRRIAELEQQLAASQSEARELRAKLARVRELVSGMREYADSCDHPSEVSKRNAVEYWLAQLEDAETVADGLRTELARVRELCPEVIAFAHLMQHKLNMNAHKDGEGWDRDSSGKRDWKSCSPQFLMDKLYEEVLELTIAIHEGDSAKSIRQEAADVGNIAMMLADVCGALSKPAEQHDPLAVSDHCGECGEPEPECACDERESLPLMARRPRHKDDDLGELYENGKRLCTISGEPPLREPMPGFVLYRIADTDEHGLKVIPRTADMPEGAKYRLTWIMQADAAGGDVEYTDSLPLALEANRSGAVSERIEDYRESGQEGKE